MRARGDWFVHARVTWAVCARAPNAPPSGGVAPDADSAKAIEDRIWAVWIVSGSDTCNLLMGRVKAAADDKDYDLAIKLLDAVVELKPDYVEA